MFCCRDKSVQNHADVLQYYNHIMRIYLATDTNADPKNEKCKK